MTYNGSNDCHSKQQHQFCWYVSSPYCCFRQLISQSPRLCLAYLYWPFPHSPLVSPLVSSVSCVFISVNVSTSISVSFSLRIFYTVHPALVVALVPLAELPSCFAPILSLAAPAWWAQSPSTVWLSLALLAQSAVCSSAPPALLALATSGSPAVLPVTSTPWCLCWCTITPVAAL